MLDNLPPGAEYDPSAPYNEPLVGERIVQYELLLKGKACIPYYNKEDLERKEEQFKRDIKYCEDALSQHLYDIISIDSYIEQIESSEFSEVW